MKTLAVLLTISSSILEITGREEAIQAPPVSIQAVDPLNQMVETAQLTNETIFNEIARLNQAFDIPISIEGILPKSGTVLNPKFTVAVQHQTVAEILDWLCTIDARYTWNRDGNMVNLFPRAALNDSRYFFNKLLPELDFREVREVADAAMAVVHQLGDPNERLYFMGIGGTQQFAKPWTATFHEITVRRALNQIAERLGPTYGWQIGGTEGQRMIMFHYKLGAQQLKSPPGNGGP